ncbi:MAG: mannose-6-phosphate isomerase, class I [Sphaerochaeta sp.]|nr:mannose-6-phosphate isomerase, class I [Sphaerochaeta sp.]
MDIVEISAVVKEYEWGNTSFIADFLALGQDGKRRAEAWWTTHHDGESVVVGSNEPLGAFLAKDALHWFGEEHLAVYGPVLPLLLKVLAIERPLSLQVHPTKEQAQAGWASEQTIRERLPKERWNYKDPNGKPEMAYVLTPTTVMCGFRPLDEIRTDLKSLMPSAYNEHFLFLDEEEKPSALLRQLFKVVYGLAQEELGALLDEYLSSVKSDARLERSLDGVFLSPADIVLSLFGEYPKDPGLLSPFLLNVLHLKKGEALYLEPRTLHAYVKGNVIELMSASDNVLRGGLTTKKVDVRELLKVLETDEQQIEAAPTVVGSSGRLHILTPTEDFHLMVLHSGTYEISDRRSIELLLVAEGSAVFTAADGKTMLKQGSCYVVAASAASYTLTVEGLVFAADVPR